MFDLLNRKINWVKFKLPTIKFDEEHSQEDEYDEYEDQAMISMQGGNLLGTPMGIISVYNQSDYNKSYNMWMCHTNFDVTKKHIIELNKIPGVDGLQPVSRYRFNVIIGYNFQEAEVKKEIEKTLIGDKETFLSAYQLVSQTINPLLPPAIQNNFEAAVSLIDTDTYAILILPNGQMVIIKSKGLTDSFIQELNDLYLVQAAVQGYLHVCSGKKKII